MKVFTSNNAKRAIKKGREKRHKAQEDRKAEGEKAQTIVPSTNGGR